MITRLSEQDKQRVGYLYANGMAVNDIRFSLLAGREIAQKTIRNAVLECGFGAVLYCPNCRENKPFVGAVRGGREFCNDCGKHV